MRKGTALGAMLLVMAVATGCGATGTTDAGTAGDKAKTSKAITAKVGAALQLKSQTGAKAEATVLGVTLAKKGKGDIAEPSANGQYAVIDVQFKSLSGQFAVNPLYMRYQSTDGKSYECDGGNAPTAGFEPELPIGDLPAGQSSRGLVAFDVPTGKGKQVQVTDELGTVIGAWTI
jgi:hypothetical protein